MKLVLIALFLSLTQITLAEEHTVPIRSMNEPGVQRASALNKITLEPGGNIVCRIEDVKHEVSCSSTTAAKPKCKIVEGNHYDIYLYVGDLKVLILNAQNNYPSTWREMSDELLEYLKAGVCTL